MLHSSFTCNSLRCSDLFVFAGLRIKYGTKRYAGLFRKSLADFFQTDEDRLFLFGAARMGLYSVLLQLKEKEDDEVIVAGYTCVVVTNAVKYAGMKAVYVDVEESTLNISTSGIRSAVTPKTKAIVVTHNFGVVYEDIDLIKSEFPGVVIIEDAAHTFGSTDKKGRMAGLIGDASFFSFEYSKPVTTGMGGLLVVNSEILRNKIDRYYDSLSFYPVWRRITIFTTLVAHLATSGFFAFLKGGVIRLLRCLGLVFKTPEVELQGEMPHHYPVKLSPSLALIGFCQTKRIRIVNKEKSDIVQLYHQSLNEINGLQEIYSPGFNYVRYPLVFNRNTPEEKITGIAAALISEGIVAGNWFNDVVHPKGSYRYCYTTGQCPVGESISGRILNLPVNIHCTPGQKELQMIREVITRHLS